MKVLLINGSPHAKGNTAAALEEMKKIFDGRASGQRSSISGIKISGAALPAAPAATRASVSLTMKSMRRHPNLRNVTASWWEAPCITRQPTPRLSPFWTACSTAPHFDKTMKVGASVVVARRGGLSATFDELNKYFTICGMPVASSQYWNSVHGQVPGEAAQDPEGLQTMRTWLARNMSFLMKSIALGKKEYGLPEKEASQFTNFVR